MTALVSKIAVQPTTLATREMENIPKYPTVMPAA